MAEAAISSVAAGDRAAWQRPEDAELSAEWHQYLEGHVLRQREDRASVEQLEAATAFQEGDGFTPWSPPTQELSSYERKMLKRIERANRRAAFETKGLPIPDALLTTAERRRRTDDQSNSCDQDGRKADERDPPRAPADEATRLAQKKDILTHGSIIPNGVEVDVAQLAAAVSWAYWARLQPFFRVVSLLSAEEFDVQAVGDPSWRGCAVADPSMSGDAEDSFWPASAADIFDEEMRRDLFWHLACGTSSSHKAAYALASALAQCVDRGLVLHVGGLPVRNVVVCFARLAAVPGERVLIDRASGLRRRSLCSRGEETWDKHTQECFGIDTAEDEPPEGPLTMAVKSLHEVNSTPFWWVGLYIEKRTQDPVQMGKLVRVGGPQGKLARVLEADDLQVIVECRDGQVLRVARSDCNCVDRSMTHIALHGPAHGNFDYVKTADVCPDLPLHVFQTPEPLHRGPVAEGAPFALHGLDKAPRFLRTARTVWAMPVGKYMASRQDLGYEVSGYVAAIVEPLVEGRFRQTLGEVGVRVAVHKPEDSQLDGREGVVLDPFEEERGTVGVRLDDRDEGSIKHLGPSQLRVLNGVICQTLTYAEMLQEATDPGTDLGVAKALERGHRGAKVRRLIGQGRLAWHLSEDQEILDGLRWLFEVGWFEHSQQAEDVEISEYKDFKQYYEDYIIFVGHPCWRRTVEVAKRLDARYYKSAPGAQKMGTNDEAEAQAVLKELCDDSSFAEYWKHLVAKRYVVYTFASGCADAGKLYASLLQRDLQERKPSAVRFLAWKHQQAVVLRSSRPFQPKKHTGYGNCGW